MRIDEAFKALVRIEDGVLMRGAFFAMLAAAGVFLLIDLREISAMNAGLPGFDPMLEDRPVLPPAVTEAAPDGPPVQPGSSDEVLRQPMRFDLRSGGVLVAEGTLDLGAGSRFAEEIEARGEYVTTVALNSPGGSVDDALAMSKLIREKKLNTKVASKALCASSCPIVFAGGRGACGGKGRADRRAPGFQRRRGKADAGTGHVLRTIHHGQSRPPSRFDGRRPRPLDQRSRNTAGPALLPD